MGARWRSAEGRQAQVSQNQAGDFIGETVRVDWIQEIGYKRPVTVGWSGGDIRVQDILMKWEDHGFGSSPPKKRPWYLRRHRTYYRVKDSGGRVFEMYLDRGAEKETWVLAKEIHLP